MHNCTTYLSIFIAFFLTTSSSARISLTLLSAASTSSRYASIRHGSGEGRARQGKRVERDTRAAETMAAAEVVVVVIVIVVGVVVVVVVAAVV